MAMAIVAPVEGDPINELVTVFGQLLKKIKEKGLRLGIQNLPHDNQHQGTHVEKLFPAENLPEEIRMREKFAELVHKNVVYRTERAHVTRLIEWAKQQLQNLSGEISEVLKTIQLPKTITFFSTPLVPRLHPTPLKW